MRQRSRRREITGSLAELQHLRKFFDTEFQVIDNRAEGLALYVAAVHGDDNPRLITCSHVNGVAATLASKGKAQTLSDACHFLSGDGG